MSIRPDRPLQNGLTLVELIVAIVIIGVCIAGVMTTYTNAVRSSADPMMVKQSYAIAEALLEEVQQAPFTDCDPADPVAETPGAACTIAFQPVGRPFDHVVKYNNLALNPYVDVSGAGLGLAGYSALVTVGPPPADLGAGTVNPITTASGSVLLISVAVTAPDTNVYTLQGYRTRYAPNAVP